MPPFHDLRSDYPLTFASFGSLDMGAFKHRPRAIVSPADSVNCRSLIGGKVGFVSWSLTHSVSSYSSDIPESSVNSHCFSPASRTHLPAQFYSSEPNPLRCVVRTSNWTRTDCVNCNSPAQSWGEQNGNQ